MNLVQLPLERLRIYHDPLFDLTPEDKEREEKLRLSLRNVGQEVPIIVNGDMVVIEGRSRVSLLRTANKSTVLAYEVSTFAEICEALEATRLASEKLGWPPNLSSNRLYQLIRTVKPQ